MLGRGEKRKNTLFSPLNFSIEKGVTEVKRDQDQESSKETERVVFFFFFLTCPEATSSNSLAGGIVTYRESLELPVE